jgi:hypothetical protein
MCAAFGRQHGLALRVVDRAMNGPGGLMSNHDNFVDRRGVSWLGFLQYIGAATFHERLLRFNGQSANLPTNKRVSADSGSDT